MSRRTHLLASGAERDHGHDFRVLALCGLRVDYLDVQGVEDPTCDGCRQRDAEDGAHLQALCEMPPTSNPAPKQPYIEFDPCGPLPRRK